MLNFIKRLTILIVLNLIILIGFRVNRVLSEPSKTYTIVIDPGHGGYDGGATGNHAKEKDLNLAISLYLKNYLESIGFKVLMIRESDVAFHDNQRGAKKRTDLEYRINYINESEADLFVSIHMNAMSDGRWHGAQTFYYPLNEENKGLAESIQKSLKAILQNTNREAKSIKSLYLFKHVKKTGVLVECGFLSNTQEETLLQDPIYQDKVAYAIYQGVLAYLGE